jgi:hypothetical protein
MRKASLDQPPSLSAEEPFQRGFRLLSSGTGPQPDEPGCGSNLQKPVPRNNYAKLQRDNSFGVVDLPNFDPQALFPGILNG